MEKKTIGGFIAALRRANGMTQKDLADRLNVSDKTVSRWERDEGAPDLSLIPVIAEIFGVTCDELLRGERKSPEEREAPESSAEATAKGERERRRILKFSLLTFKNRTAITLGISAVGLIAALICNFAFLRGRLGFYLGLVFFASGVVCQVIFTNRALFAVDDDGPDTAEKADFRRQVIGLTRNALAVTAGLCGFTVPMATIGAYEGLALANQLAAGAICAAGFLVVYAVGWYFAGAALVKKGVLALTERGREIYRHNHRLQAVCAGVLAGLAAVTAVGHVYCIDPSRHVKRTVFNDIDSFVEYMERDVPSSGYESWYGAEDYAAPPEPADGGEAGDAGEGEITPSHLYDGEGNVLVTYYRRNREVMHISYSAAEGVLMPISAYTWKDWNDAVRQSKIWNLVFCGVYALEAVGVLAVYLRKRWK